MNETKIAELKKLFFPKSLGKLLLLTAGKNHHLLISINLIFFLLVLLLCFSIDFDGRFAEKLSLLIINACVTLLYIFLLYKQKKEQYLRITSLILITISSVLLYGLPTYFSLRNEYYVGFSSAIFLFTETSLANVSEVGLLIFLSGNILIFVNNPPGYINIIIVLLNIALIFVLYGIQKTQTCFSRHSLKLFESNQSRKRFWKNLLSHEIPVGIILFSNKQKTRDSQSINEDDAVYLNDYAKSYFSIGNNMELLSLLKKVICDENYMRRDGKTIEDGVEEGEITLFDWINKRIFLEPNYKPSIISMKNCNVYRQCSEFSSGFEELLNLKCKIGDQNKYFDAAISQYSHENQEYTLLTIKDIGKKRIFKKIKELDLFKDHMVNSFSHDLKTPLNYINGTISLLMLQKEIKFDLRREWLESIKQQSELLFCMINNIIDYANINNKTFRLDILEVDVRELIENVANLFRLSAKEKNVDLIISFDVSTPQVIESDPMRIKQILVNLLTNALKFTTKGFIKLFTKFVEPEFLEISVEDSGPGFDIENMVSFNARSPKIRGDYERNRHGIGFGLAVVKELSKKIGPVDSLEISSEIGVGSRFSFKLFVATPVSRTNSPITNKILTKRMINQRIYKSDEDNELELMGECDWKRRKPSSEKKSSNAMRNKSESKSIHATLYSESDDYIPQEKENQPKINSLIVGGGSFKGRRMKSSNSSFDKVKTHLPNMNNIFLFDKNETNISLGMSSKEELIFSTNNMHRPDVVLIVDDTPFNIKIIENFITQIDPHIAIRKAFNGKEALDVVSSCLQANEKIKLMLLDCNMPILNGYETSMKLKEMIIKNEIEDFPIIAVTAYSKEVEKEKCKVAGMDDFLGKPFTLEQFKNIYFKWMKRLNFE